MAKQKMRCVFSEELCRECSLFRGRHYYLCFSRTYRGYLGAEPVSAVIFGSHQPLLNRNQIDPHGVVVREGKENDQ